MLCGVDVSCINAVFLADIIEWISFWKNDNSIHIRWFAGVRRATRVHFRVFSRGAWIQWDRTVTQFKWCCSHNNNNNCINSKSIFKWRAAIIWERFRFRLSEATNAGTAHSFHSDSDEVSILFTDWWNGYGHEHEESGFFDSSGRQCFEYYSSNRGLFRWVVSENGSDSVAEYSDFLRQRGSWDSNGNENNWISTRDTV